MSIKLNKNRSIAKFGKFKVDFKSRILSYIELPDRIIFLVNWLNLAFYAREKIENISPRDATPEERVRENLFCYSKQTGKLLWQVAEYNHKGYKEDSVYVGMAIEIKENGKVVKRYAIMVDKHEIEIDKPNLDLSKCEFSAGLQNGFEYLIDIDTGEILDCIGWTK